MLSFEAFAELVRARRSQLAIDLERDIDPTLVDQLCATAALAPNHQHTWPWLFGVFTGDSRRALGEVAAKAMQARGDGEPKVTKTRTKYMRSPVLLVVGTAPGETELRTQENRDAVAAGIQTLLLGATAMGLGSFWSSCPKGANEAVTAHCGWPTGTHITAMIYLGWPTHTPPDRERPAANIKYFG